MSQTPQPSGVDLAHVALQVAREAAKKTGARTAKSKPRVTRTVRRDGRAPMRLGEAFTALMAERGWDIPAAGAGLCERWAALAPDLADHVAAVGYDAERGELTLRPDSTTWATKVRLEASRIVADANRSARTDAVRTVRVLSPGALPAPSTAADPDPVRTPVPQGPVRTREAAAAGYRRALESHQQVHTRRELDPAITDAVERQNRVLREASRCAFPEAEAARDDQPTPIDAALAQRRRDADAVRLRALHQARAERPAVRGSGHAPAGRSAAVLRLIRVRAALSVGCLTVGYGSSSTGSWEEVQHAGGGFPGLPVRAGSSPTLLDLTGHEGCGPCGYGRPHGHHS